MAYKGPKTVKTPNPHGWEKDKMGDNKGLKGAPGHGGNNTKGK